MTKRFTSTRRLFAGLATATVLGAGLPALAAAPAHAAGCSTTAFDGRLPAGSYVCAYRPTLWTYDSRLHAFVVGTNATNAIYHTWADTPGGPLRSAWISLGGTGRSSVEALNYRNPGGGLALAIGVYTTGGGAICKDFNDERPGAWYPSPTGWESC